MFTNEPANSRRLHGDESIKIFPHSDLCPDEVKHVVFSPGIVVSFSVSWLRTFGLILVPLFAAVLIPALVTGIVATMVNDLSLCGSVLACKLHQSITGGFVRSVIGKLDPEIIAAYC